MKAKLGTLPSDDERWAYEIKWDGYRTLVFVDRAGDRPVRLQSTSGLDVSDRWPEMAGIESAINATSAIIDGELCVLDDEGKPRFDLIQRSERAAVFHAFDVLAIDGNDVTSLAYESRRALLESLVEPGPHWIVPANRIGSGTELLAATGAAELEGIMAKRLGSTYRPGTRTDDWRKIKHRRKIEVTIGGFTEGTGNRADSFGALLVGRQVDGELRFAGGVGTGFTAATLRSLRAKLDDLTTDTPPFDNPVPALQQRGATWVRPELHATIEIAELTNDGYARHATFLRLVR